MFLEIFAEERGIGEVQIVGYLLAISCIVMSV